MDFGTDLTAEPPDVAGGRSPGREDPLDPGSGQDGRLRRRFLGHAAAGPEDRPLAERCLMGFNSGPPMMPSAYNNSVQIFQTPGRVVVFNEMINSARIIPMDGQPHLPQRLRQWIGDSRGRWDGDTLVVETTNFLRETHFEGSSANLRLVERFTRVGPGELAYEFNRHGRGEVVQPLDGADTDDADRRAHLRVRLPRGQLRHGQHAGRRPRAGAGGRTLAPIPAR